MYRNNRSQINCTHNNYFLLTNFLFSADRSLKPASLIFFQKCGELQKCNRVFTVACKQPADTYGTCGLTVSRSELGRALEIVNNIEMNTTVDKNTVETVLERMHNLVNASIAHEEVGVINTFLLH